MKRIKTLLKLNIILMLVSYLLMYIMPLGIYYAENYVREQDGNGFFYFDRLLLLVIVGVGCSICLMSYAFIRNKNSFKRVIFTFILSVLHFFVIMTEKNLVFEIARYVAAYEGTFETGMSGMGKILYILIAIVNIIVLVLTIVGVIYCKIKKTVADKEDGESITAPSAELMKFRKKVKILNVVFLCSAIFFFTLVTIVSMALEIDNLGFIAMIPGILVPFVIYTLVFCNKWISKGQWLGVILTYIGLIYYAYNMIFYLFEDSIGMTLRYLGLDEIRIFMVVTFALVIMSLIIGICGIMDKKILKK